MANGVTKLGSDGRLQSIPVSLGIPRPDADGHHDNFPSRTPDNCGSVLMAAVSMFSTR